MSDNPDNLDNPESSLNRCPLGVMPFQVWVQHRISAVAAAIDRQAKYHSPDPTLLHQWAKELELLTLLLDKNRPAV
jgi:hypothetical protein